MRWHRCIFFFPFQHVSPAGSSYKLSSLTMESHVTLFCLVLAVCSLVHCEEHTVSQNITTEPANLIKARLKTRVEVVCTSPLQGISTYWMTSNGTAIDQLTSELISDNNGTLVIPVMDMDFDGIYNCSTSDNMYTTYVTIEGYVMPTYFKEGMIILAIAAGLVVIFILCLVHQTYRNRRNSKKGYNPKPLPT